MQAEAPFDQGKGSHRAPPKQYGLTTLSSAQLASHLSQNSFLFPVPLLLLYDLGNMVVNVVVPVGFDVILVSFETVLVGFETVLADLKVLIVDFDSNTCPLLLH